MRPQDSWLHGALADDVIKAAIVIAGLAAFALAAYSVHLIRQAHFDRKLARLRHPSRQWRLQRELDQHDQTEEFLRAVDEYERTEGKP